MDNLSTEILFNQDQTAYNPQLEILKQHFPHCFDKNGDFLIDKFSEIIQTQNINIQKEHYQFNWLGKSYAKILRELAPNTLLTADNEHNNQPKNQNSQNLLIQGDNLEVLKHLKNAYTNAIKMIYIDPPYNTGSDGFVYQDDRKFSVNELMQLGGMDKDEAERILNFTAKKSNSHSAWLTFMYPRLYVAKELLKDDGVIFISIDDNEQAQLKILCDEVFGEENFVADIIWKKKNVVQNDAKFFSTDHEYVLCYSKDADKLKLNRLARTSEQEARYQNPDNDPRGAWTSVALQAKSGSSIYEITFPNGVTWKPVEGTFPRLSKESLINAYNEGRLWFGKDGNNIPRLKKYLSEVRDGVLSNTIWFNDEVGSTQLAKENVKKLLQSNVFDTPKPIDFIIKMIKLTTNQNELILDFFAGSGTTAHAVMQLNSEDFLNDRQGNRQFICVQLPELTDKKSEAYKAGYHTIFDITKARIQKASEKIQNDNPSYQGDLGFKIFKTTPDFRNLEHWDLDDWGLNNGDLFNTTFDNEQLSTLLTTWQVFDGFALTDSIQEIKLNNYTAYLISQNLYLLHQDFNTLALKALLLKLDNDKTFCLDRIIFLGWHFDSTTQKELAQAIQTYANKKSLDLKVLARY